MAALIRSATDLKGTELKDQTRQLITNEPLSMLIIPASRIFKLTEPDDEEGVKHVGCDEEGAVVPRAPCPRQHAVVQPGVARPLVHPAGLPHLCGHPPGLQM